MKNENEINDETKSSLEISLCALLLESSRRYSVLADAVFGFSVEQSHFANKISGQRMTLAKIVIQKKTDFVIALEGEALETYQCARQIDNALELWEDCLSLDVVIQEILEGENDSWGPIILGLQNTIQEGEEFLKEIAEGRGGTDSWHCLNCGAIQTFCKLPTICSICGLGMPWQKSSNFLSREK